MCPARARVAGLAKVHKLSSNESPLGPSPRAIEAFRANADQLAIYPDGSSRLLREAIAKRFGLDAEQIICGNGSDELLSLLAHVFLRPGDEGLYSQYGFLEYPIAIRAAGGIAVAAEEIALTANVDALLAKVTAKTKIVYLANPNNPTGTYLPFSEVKRLHAGLPGDVLLVARRRLRRICRAQRLRRRHRAGLDQPERRHDAHLLEDLRPRQFAHRLGLCAGARSSTR